MMKRLMRLVGGVSALAFAGSPAWAHPSTGFHAHAEEVGGLLVASLVILGLQVLRRAGVGRGGRGRR